MPTYTPVLVQRTMNSGSAPTLTEIDELPYDSLSWSSELNVAGVGEVECDMRHLPASVKPFLVDIYASPTELWIWRDNVKVFAGPVVYRDVNETALTLQAPGLLWYLAFMRRLTDYEATADEFTHAKTLVDDYQAQTYGNLGGIVTSGIGASGVTTYMKLVGSEAPQVLKEIQDASQATNGYDLYVDPTTRALTLVNPTRGTDLTALVVIGMAGIERPRETVQIDPDRVATEFFAFASNDDESTLSSTASDASRRSLWGRLVAAEQYRNVTDQTILDALAAKELATRSSLWLEIAPTLRPVTGAGAMDFDAGDTVQYDYDVGFGRVSASRRIRQKKVSVGKGGTEEALAVAFV